MEVAFKKVIRKLKIVRGIYSFIFIVLIFLIYPSRVQAESPYVLPYPSYMPGSMFYKVHNFINALEEYWYYGDFGKIKYNLSQADNSLVEAKTLFDYKQYLLGSVALKRSNFYFQRLKPNLENSKKHGKDISEVKKTLSDAALKHKETLLKMKEGNPETFIWRPEKGSSSTIYIWDEIESSIKLRESL